MNSNCAIKMLVSDRFNTEQSRFENYDYSKTYEPNKHFAVGRLTPTGYKMWESLTYEEAFAEAQKQTDNLENDFIEIVDLKLNLTVYMGRCEKLKALHSYRMTTTDAEFEKLRIYGEFTEDNTQYALDIINEETGEVLCYQLNKQTLENFIRNSNYTLIVE